MPLLTHCSKCVSRVSDRQGEEERRERGAKERTESVRGKREGPGGRDHYKQPSPSEGEESDESERGVAREGERGREGEGKGEGGRERESVSE